MDLLKFRKWTNRCYSFAVNDHPATVYRDTSTDIFWITLEKDYDDVSSPIKITATSFDGAILNPCEGIIDFYFENGTTIKFQGFQKHNPEPIEDW